MSRVVQLIRRDIYGNELHKIDVAGPNAGRQGVKVLKMEGIWHAPRSETDEQSAFVEGSRPGLSRVLPRPVKLTMLTEEVDDDEFGYLSWQDADDNLWDITPARASFVLRMEDEDGISARELTLRRVIEPEPGRDDDPAEDKKMKWVISATGHDPFWYGEEITREFIKETGSGVGDFTNVVNPGDQPAVLKYVSREATNAETWTLPDATMRYPSWHTKAGQLVTHPLPTINAGQHFMVDTHALAEQFTVNGIAQALSLMKGEFFSSYLPPTKDTGPVDLPVKVVGGTPNSGVRLIVQTRYDRPMGR